MNTTTTLQDAIYKLAKEQATAEARTLEYEFSELILKRFGADHFEIVLSDDNVLYKRNAGDNLEHVPGKFIICLTALRDVLLKKFINAATEEHLAEHVQRIVNSLTKAEDPAK